MKHGATMRGIWSIERWDRPIEWYAAKLLGINEADLLAQGENAWNRLPAATRIQSDLLMRRDAKPIKDVFAECEQVFENLFLNTGINALLNLMIAAGTTTGGGAISGVPYFSNAQTRIAVGDSSTAAAATQTWLQAASNKLAILMDATYPLFSGGGGTSTTFTTATFRMTAGSALGNFAWQEFCVDNGGNTSSNTTGSNSSTLAAGMALDRVVSNQGTKASGQTWQPSLALTIS
jgi:hypothetical protein